MSISAKLLASEKRKKAKECGVGKMWGGQASPPSLHMLLVEQGKETWLPTSHNPHPGWSSGLLRQPRPNPTCQATAAKAGSLCSALLGVLERWEKSYPEAQPVLQPLLLTAVWPFPPVALRSLHMQLSQSITLPASFLGGGLDSLPLLLFRPKPPPRKALPTNLAGASDASPCASCG